MARLHPSLQVSNPENIPQQGPCVITVNHYHRPGFGAEWLALSISALVSVHVQWVMTAEFMYEGKWFQPLGSSVSRILLKRIARVYGFTCMPPMPPRPQDVQARAASVRAVLEVVRNTREPMLGLAPEGQDASDNGVLTRPPAGVGRFGLLLVKAGLTLAPVGAYEADGIFHLRFGEGYVLSVPPGLHPEEKDRQASQCIMEHIALLLPPRLRGEFA
jgi:1-acyl-sn-glycerol-3-phosphate acyltransferase